MKKSILPMFVVLTIAACSSAPLRFGINQSVSFGLPLVPPTAGAIIYASEAVTFQGSNITPASVRLEGNAAASGVSRTVIAFVHGSTSDPLLGGGCAKVSSIIVCLPNSTSRLGANPITLETSGAKTAFSLGDTNQETMKTALRNGKVWLGLEVTDGFAANANITFSDLAVIAALF